MTSAFRRFEILLPLRFNDGQEVPGELIADTLLELEQRFGAVSSETQTIQGLWRLEGRSYRDDLTESLSTRPTPPRVWPSSRNKMFLPAADAAHALPDTIREISRARSAPFAGLGISGTRVPPVFRG